MLHTPLAVPLALWRYPLPSTARAFCALARPLTVQPVASVLRSFAFFPASSAVVLTGFARSIRTRGQLKPLPPPSELMEPWLTAEKLTVAVHTLQGQKVAAVQLNHEMFGQPIRRDIVQRVVEWQRAMKRQGTNKTKNRAEVRGSNRKPFPQKGSGRARQGTRRSAPHQRGGGASMGPVPRFFGYKMNRKVRVLAMQVALSAKLREGNLHIVDELVLTSHKTKLLNQVLEPQEFYKTLVVDMEPHPNFILASRPLAYLNLLAASDANVYDIVRHKILMLSLSGLRYLEHRLLGTPLAAPYPQEKYAVVAAQKARLAAEAAAQTEDDVLSPRRSGPVQ